MVFRVQKHHSPANFVGSPKSLVQIWPLSNWIHSFSINFLHGQNPHHPNIFNSTCHVGVHVHPQWQGGVTHGRWFSHLSQTRSGCENHQKVCFLCQLHQKEMWNTIGRKLKLWPLTWHKNSLLPIWILQHNPRFWRVGWDPIAKAHMTFRSSMLRARPDTAGVFSCGPPKG